MYLGAAGMLLLLSASTLVFGRRLGLWLAAPPVKHCCPLWVEFSSGPQLRVGGIRVSV